MIDLPLYTAPVRERLFHLSDIRKTPIGDVGESGSAYIANPVKPVGDRAGLRVVLGLHGSGRSAESYRGIPFYRYQRDRAFRSGCVFAALSNGIAGWGHDEALADTLTFLDLLCGEFGSDIEIVPWASSAGGVLMYRLVKELSVSDRYRPIERAVGTFPVYDLLSMIGSSPACGRAWRAKTVAELEKNVSGRNPPSFADHLAGCRFWIGHGVEDTCVDITENSEKLVRDVSPHGGRVALHRAEGGHSVDNYQVYDDEQIGRFLECIPEKS